MNSWKELEKNLHSLRENAVAWTNFIGAAPPAIGHTSICKLCACEEARKWLWNNKGGSHRTRSESAKIAYETKRAKATARGIPQRGMKCSVPDCDRPISNKGVCTKHYQRFLKHGSPYTVLTHDGHRKHPLYPSYTEMIYRCNRLYYSIQRHRYLRQVARKFF